MAFPTGIGGGGGLIDCEVHSTGANTQQAFVLAHFLTASSNTGTHFVVIIPSMPNFCPYARYLYPSSLPPKNK